MSPERKKVMELLRSYFGTNLAGRLKALGWYHANNPLLGGISPKHMVQAGKADKLVNFIRQQFDGNKP